MLPHCETDASASMTETRSAAGRMQCCSWSHSHRGFEPVASVGCFLAPFHRVGPGSRPYRRETVESWKHTRCHMTTG